MKLGNFQQSLFFFYCPNGAGSRVLRFLVQTEVGTFPSNPFFPLQLLRPNILSYDKTIDVNQISLTSIDLGKIRIIIINTIMRLIYPMIDMIKYNYSTMFISWQKFLGKTLNDSRYYHWGCKSNFKENSLQQAI